MVIFRYNEKSQVKTDTAKKITFACVFCVLSPKAGNCVIVSSKSLRTFRDNLQHVVVA